MKRGPYFNRGENYEKARSLRRDGLGYRLIAKRLDGTSWSTVKNWVKDIPIDKAKAQRVANDLLFRPFSELQIKSSRRNFLIRLRGNICERCGLAEWLSRKIILEMEHKDGNKNNNELENLELLCPNCHSFTPTWRRKKPN